MTPGYNVIAVTVCRIPLTSGIYRLCRYNSVYFAVKEDDIESGTCTLKEGVKLDNIEKTFSKDIDECMSKTIALDCEIWRKTFGVNIEQEGNNNG